MIKMDSLFSRWTALLLWYFLFLIDLQRLHTDRESRQHTENFSPLVQNNVSSFPKVLFQILQLLHSFPCTKDRGRYPMLPYQYLWPPRQELLHHSNLQPLFHSGQDQMHISFPMLWKAEMMMMETMIKKMKYEMWWSLYSKVWKCLRVVSKNLPSTCLCSRRSSCLAENTDWLLLYHPYYRHSIPFHCRP